MVALFLGGAGGPEEAFAAHGVDGGGGGGEPEGFEVGVEGFPV